jgi:hypothetical protein
MHNNNPLLRRTNGQAIPLVALAALLLVALSGLAVDGANAFNQRRNAMNGSDAAAFAGTRVILEQRKAGGNSASAVYQAVEQYLDEHGLNDGVAFQWTAYYVDKQAARLGANAQVQNSGSVPSGAYGVEVELRYTFQTYLMRVMGRSELTVDADSIALYGPVAEIEGEDLIPLTVAQHNVVRSDDDEEFCIFGEDPEPDPDTGIVPPDACSANAPGAFKVRPGSFGQVSFDPDGSNATGSNGDCVNNDGSAPSPRDSTRYWWCNGSQYPIAIGDDLAADPGMVSSQLKDEIEWRRENRPLGVVPVYSMVQGNGNNAEYWIVGFMAVELLDEKVTGSNKDRYVLARRVEYMTTAGSMSWGSVDGGVYAVNLVK